MAGASANGAFNVQFLAPAASRGRDQIGTKDGPFRSPPDHGIDVSHAHIDFRKKLSPSKLFPQLAAEKSKNSASLHWTEFEVPQGFGLGRSVRPNFICVCINTIWPH
jgi:hypothetical protein